MVTSGSSHAAEKPYWLTTAPPPQWQTTSPPVVPATADIVIVGGGIVGLSAALWAARIGASTVILEQQEFSCGATSRNIGVMLFGGGQLDRSDLLERVCAEEQITERPQIVGHISLIDSMKYVEIVEEESKARPDAVAILSHADCERLLGTRVDRRFIAGRWARGGMVVDPVRFACGIAAAAARRGANLVAGHKVLHVTSRRGAVITDLGATAIRSRAAIIAAAYGASELVPGLAEVLYPRSGHVWRAECPQGTFGPAMAVNFGDIYWRQLGDGTILLGGDDGPDWRSEREPPKEPGTGPRRRRRSALTDFFLKSFPQLPEVRPVGRWTGTMTCTTDGRPIIGPVPWRPGIWLMTGFGGHGLPPALYAGMMCVRAALGVGLPAHSDFARYALTRFTQLTWPDGPAA